MIKEKLLKVSNAINLLCMSILTALYVSPAKVFAAPAGGNSGGTPTTGTTTTTCPSGYSWTTVNNVEGCWPQGTQGNLDSSARTILDTMSRISNYILAGAVIIGVIYTIYSGIKIMTSAGNPNKKEAAKQSLFSVIIGLAIVGAAALIASIAFGLLAQN